MFTKEDILKEIRLTAKNNGGIPLGRKRFEYQTGINEWDLQKYWPRFGDAIREAGFSPNKLKTAYDDTYLFEKFISLMRELKNWPTKGDLRVKRNSDPEFPSDGAFFRLGSKQKLAAKLLEYAKNKNYEDVIKICEEVLKEFEELEESVDEVLGVEEYGSVYLARSGRFYKIGRTNNLGRRHHEITILLPEGFKLIHEIKTDDPGGIEAYWHRRFESKRKNGEWFDLNPIDV